MRPKDEHYDDAAKLRQELGDLWPRLRSAEADNERLRLELAEAHDNWWKHPKAQLEIGLKARLRLELSHIEAIAGPTPRDELGIDDDYWSGLCDKVLKMRDELAEAREARGPVDHAARYAFGHPHTEVAEDLFALVNRIDRAIASDQPTVAGGWQAAPGQCPECFGYGNRNLSDGSWMRCDFCNGSGHMPSDKST